jgi:hypothetical protein
MKKRLHILVAAFALLLSLGATSVGATMGVHALKSSARSTVEPVKKQPGKKKKKVCKAPAKLVHGKCVKPKKPRH